MTIATFFKHIFGGSPDGALTAVSAASPAAVTAVKTFASSTAQQVIAGLKATDIGSVVAADIATVESTGLSGAAKFDQVVATTVPLILKYAEGGGIAAVEADVVGIAQGLVQTIYLDVQSTSFAKLATPLLKLLGL